MDALEDMALESYDRAIGLDLADVAVDCCITKAPCGGEKAGKSPVDRGKQGIKRSMMVDACGIPLGGVVTAPANRHDSPRRFWRLPWMSFREAGRVARAGERTPRPRLRLEAHQRAPGKPWLGGRDLQEGQVPAPLGATKRWVVERTNSWSNAHKKLLWCTEREGRVIDFWIAFSNVIIIVGRLIREGWRHYRWEGRPSRRP